MFILEEIWKIIEKYPQFEVSNCGYIRRIATGKILNRNVNKDGYYDVCVSLGKRGLLKLFKIHREVAIAFIPNPENKPQVNHIDGDKLNPHVSNLEWATASENIIHAYNNNLTIANKGEECGFSKLTEQDVLFIRANYSPYGRNGISARALARMFGLDKDTVLAVVERRTWKHI